MKIVIMGLGLYEKGSGISAAKFFIANSHDVLITDLKSKKELMAQIKELEKFCRIKKKPLPKYFLGGHKESDFKNVDIVMRNPGVKHDSKFLKLAKNNGAKIETDISIFLKNTDANIIGITGTRGKSTTTALTYQILKKKYPRVHLGGNIKISPLSFINDIKKDDIVVLELSSWMLENFDEYKLAPHIALITNIYPDHLNMHKNMAEYIAAKKNIFKHQTKDDILILNYDNSETKKWKGVGDTYYFSKKALKNKLGACVKNDRIIFYGKKKTNNVAELSDVKLKGDHNLENVLGAVAISKLMGLPCASVKKVLKEFKGLDSRQELIKEVGGVKYINDTTATTPDGAIAALRTFGAAHLKTKKQKNTKTQKQKNIILICGGKDKGLEYEQFAHEIKKYCKAVVLLPGSATQKMKPLLHTTYYTLHNAKDMKEAVSKAKEQSIKGDIILLSPAAASFGLFKNEFDRGTQFKKEI